MFDFIGVGALLLLAALGTWLVLKARRAQNRLVKWAGIVVSGLVALAAIVALGVTLVGFYRINYPANRRPASDIKVAGTPEQIARGARFGGFCAGCHSPKGKPPLVGANFAEGGPPMGTFWAANLTAAGEIATWSDGEVIRALREGIHKSGRALVIMPSEVFRHLSDADAEAVVAYLRAQPAVEPNTPPTRLGVLVAFLIGAGIAPTSAQSPITEPIVAPPEAATPEHGRYLTSVLGCEVCHGEDLKGGTAGGMGPPQGPNIRVILAKWTAGEFSNTIRTGVDPWKHTITEEMPWREISAFATDTDLEAIYAYVRGLTDSVK
jgi:mono/diheme cytochrome c family protein